MSPRHPFLKCKAFIYSLTQSIENSIEYVNCSRFHSNMQQDLDHICKGNEIIHLVIELVVLFDKLCLY